MSRVKHFLMEVEEDFYSLLDDTTNNVALSKIEYKFGTMAKEHCKILLNGEKNE